MSHSAEKNRKGGHFGLHYTFILLKAKNICDLLRESNPHSPASQTPNNLVGQEIEQMNKKCGPIVLNCEKKLATVRLNKPGPAQVGAISKAQKWRAKVSQCRKTERGDPLWFFNIHSVAKHEKTG